MTLCHSCPGLTLCLVNFEKLVSYLDNVHLSRFPELKLYKAMRSWLRHDRCWGHTNTIIQNISDPIQCFLRRLRHQNFILLTAVLWSWQSIELFSKCSPAAFVGHEINLHPLCQTPNISIWGMIRHSMVKSKIFLLKKPRVLWEPEGPQVPLCLDCLPLSITSRSY